MFVFKQNPDIYTIFQRDLDPRQLASKGPFLLLALLEHDLDLRNLHCEHREVLSLSVHAFETGVRRDQECMGNISGIRNLSRFFRATTTKRTPRSTPLALPFDMGGYDVSTLHGCRRTITRRNMKMSTIETDLL